MKDDLVESLDKYNLNILTSNSIYIVMTLCVQVFFFRTT